jgi:hypothetical protein
MKTDPLGEWVIAGSACNSRTRKRLNDSSNLAGARFQSNKARAIFRWHVTGKLAADSGFAIPGAVPLFGLNMWWMYPARIAPGLNGYMPMTASCGAWICGGLAGFCGSPALPFINCWLGYVTLCNRAIANQGSSFNRWATNCTLAHEVGHTCGAGFLLAESFAESSSMVLFGGRADFINPARCFRPPYDPFYYNPVPRWGP